MSSTYDKQYFNIRDTLPHNLALTLKIFIRDKKITHILDVGCGSGRLVKYFNDNGLKAIGCDPSPNAIKMALKINPNKSIIKAPATRLPFKDHTFDLVTSISVIEHLTKRETIQFILESKRVLSQNGYIFIVTPNYLTPLRILQKDNWFGFKDPTHINFYTPLDLSKILTKNGFNNIKLQYKTKYHKSFDWEFPSFYSNLPIFIKRLLIYLFFSTPVTLIRNSFWISARKNE